MENHKLQPTFRLSNPLFSHHFTYSPPIQSFTMAFRIEPAVYEDIEPLINLYLDAFKDDELYPHMYPDLPREEVIRFESSGPKAVFGKYPWVKIWKVVEGETGYVFSVSWE